ncbi:MAG: hypothetical protein J5I90_15675 [Caldilineales bacterium]|nr:hypothetical protein [Caldilineales bacterium]
MAPGNHTKQVTGAGRASDIAIDGLLAGVAAGVVMAVALELIGLVTGSSFGAMLARLDPGGASSTVNGLLAHIAVSGIYGLVFGLLYKLVRSQRILSAVPVWLLGVVYGLLLLIISQLLTSFNQYALQGISFVSLLAVHLVYGAVLGWLVGRRERAG